MDAFEVAIALGSNMGDRLENLRQGVARLRGSVESIQTSTVYETDAMYVVDQPAFLNAVLVGRTALGPLQLLRLLKSVESEVGRGAGVRNGPRTLDLDLILFGQIAMRSSGGTYALRVPHPRLAERRFVLQPLVELRPETRIPGIGALSALFAATESQSNTVRKYGDGVL